MALFRFQNKLQNKTLVNSILIDHNDCVYDQVRGQRDSVSRYTIAKQRDDIRNLLPSNRPKGAHGAKRSN
jgi:hypothetical protein